MKKSVLPAILLTFLVLFADAAAQTSAQPYQEKLLNGLKVLVWNDPAAEKVTLRLRIHSGAAFDPKDKTGVMALLAGILFPDEQTFAYFKEDLSGELKVESNYDYIEITASGKADEFVNILDTIRAGIITTPITPENFAKVRDAQAEKLKAALARPEVIADRAVVKRLLGDFPYGRPADGTPESLAKLDRFDLVTAKEKFLDADNATLAIYGKVDPRFAVKAAKQMLGNWSKSDGVVPSTFAQPQDPDTKIQLIDQPGATTAEVRFAVRGLAANDKDTAAAIFWSAALGEKIKASLPAECAVGFRASHRGRVLPGILLISGSFPVEQAGKCFDIVKNILAKADTEKVSPDAFNAVKGGFLQAMSNQTSNLDVIATLWLNADTLKWAKVSDQTKSLNDATPADGDKVAARIFWKAPVVSVIVGDAAKIKPQFDASAQFALNAAQEEQIKKEVTDLLASWKTAMEGRDLDAMVKFYAPKLDVFYRGNNIDQSIVRAELDKGLRRFESMKLEISKISVRPDSETTASTTFDKRWNFRGKDMISTGAVQQFFKLVKTGGQWQIVEEKELQLYQMNNQPVAQPPAAKPQ